MNAILTVGHGDLPQERLLGNLRAAGAARLVDVRSAPYSRRHPQFNRRELERALPAAGVAYEWAPALGGRPGDAALLTDGKPDYAKMARAPAFLGALDRLIATAADTPTAIMCAESRPGRCHRTLLVARALAERGVRVRHLLKDGAIADAAPLAAPLL